MTSIYFNLKEWGESVLLPLLVNRSIQQKGERTALCFFQPHNNNNNNKNT